MTEKKRHGSWKEAFSDDIDKEDVLPTAIAGASALGTSALSYLKDKRDPFGTKKRAHRLRFAERSTWHCTRNTSLKSPFSKKRVIYIYAYKTKCF